MPLPLPSALIWAPGLMGKSSRKHAQQPGSRVKQSQTATGIGARSPRSGPACAAQQQVCVCVCVCVCVFIVWKGGARGSPAATARCGRAGAYPLLTKVSYAEGLAVGCVADTAGPGTPYAPPFPAPFAADTAGPGTPYAPLLAAAFRTEESAVPGVASILSYADGLAAGGELAGARVPALAPLLPSWVGLLGVDAACLRDRQGKKRIQGK